MSSYPFTQADPLSLIAFVRFVVVVCGAFFAGVYFSYRTAFGAQRAKRVALAVAMGTTLWLCLLAFVAGSGFIEANSWPTICIRRHCARVRRGRSFRPYCASEKTLW